MSKINKIPSENRVYPGSDMSSRALPFSSLVLDLVLVSSCPCGCCRSWFLVETSGPRPPVAGSVLQWASPAPSGQTRFWSRRWHQQAVWLWAITIPSLKWDQEHLSQRNFGRVKWNDGGRTWGTRWELSFCWNLAGPCGALRHRAFQTVANQGWEKRQR